MNTDHFNALPKGYRLEDYEFVRVLGHGGFGITYLAFDDNLDAAVAIKEYLPDEFAIRDSTQSVIPKSSSMAEDFQWGLDRFLDEAKTLARFRHHNLIQVHRFFRANGTAYIVMEFAEGEPLSKVLTDRKRLPEQEVREMLMPIVDGLERVHGAKILHRDIKPANVMIRDDGTPVLIDFGAARQAVGAKSRSITAIVSAGYAPLEQYVTSGNQGPWTDIYALGALAYKCLTGDRPPEAPERAMEDPYVPLAEHPSVSVSASFAAAVDCALRVRGQERPQDVQAWKAMLQDDYAGRGRAAEERRPRRPEERLKPGREKVPAKRGRPRLYWALAAALLVAVTAGASYYFWPEFPGPGGGAQSRSQIEAAQEMLNRLGYQVGQPSGQLTARTIAAIRSFERDQKLFETGEVDSLLMQKLRQEMDRRDEAAWQTALAAGTNAAFEGYRRNWPRGRHVGEIEATKDSLAWRQARAANSIPALEAYRAAWPRGARFAEAGREITRLREQAAQELTAKAERERAAKLRAAREETAWTEAKRLDTVAAFQSYLNGFPAGKYFSEANYNIGLKYESGKGARQDGIEAEKFYRRGAEKGYAPAQFKLGRLYHLGPDVAKNGFEAVKWYRRSADQGYALGQNNLGVMYENGVGVARDYAVAVKWYRRAGDQGLAVAQNNVGVMYEIGRGVPKSHIEALRWYRLAAGQRYASSQDNLGNMYRLGRGVTKSDTEAVKWYRLAAGQRNASGQYHLGYMYSRGRGVSKSDTEAVKWYRLAADQGHANAQNSLGFMYRYGRGVSKNFTQAVNWYRKAANQRLAAARYNLGGMYANGRGVRKSGTEAAKWYRLAADQGYASAQYSLGLAYRDGNGVSKNPTQAVKWYRLAADQGHANAQGNLGFMYEMGRGVGKNVTEAAKWYRKAAVQGVAIFQTNLGYLYASGSGVAKNDKEAVKWYRLAAAQNFSRAQNNLGFMYQYGRGLSMDLAAARNWYTKAARNGNGLAQHNLGLMYENGRGVQPDLVEAYKWFIIARDSKHSKAQAALDRLNSKLRRSQVAEAGRRAKQWQKTYLKS